MGHLTEKEALELANNCEKYLNYKQVNTEDLIYDRLVKMPNKRIFDYEEINEDPENPNSAVASTF